MRARLMRVFGYAALLVVVATCAAGAATFTNNTQIGDTRIVHCVNNGQSVVAKTSANNGTVHCDPPPTTTTVPPTTTQPPPTTQPPTTTQPPPTTVPPARVSACNGTGDDTANIQTAINRGGTVTIPAGTCMVTGLRTIGGTIIDGTGPASVLKLLPLSASASTPVIDAASFTEVRNVKIDGSRDQQPAHSFSDSYNCSGGKYAVSTCGGRGFKAGIRGEAVTNLYVHNVEITGTYGAAMATIDSSIVTLNNSNVHDTNFESIYATATTIPFSTNGGHDITVSGNTLARIGVVAGSGCSPNCAESDGIVVSRATTVRINHNTLNGVDRCMVKIEGSNDVQVDDNTASGGRVQYPGIQFQAESWPGLPGPPRVANVNVSVYNNTISGDGFQAGVQINSSSTVQSMAKNFDVFGNTVTHTSIGVLADGSTGLDNIAIHDNTFNQIDGSSYAAHPALYLNGGGINGFTESGNTHDGAAMAPFAYAGAFSASRFFN